MADASLCDVTNCRRIGRRFVVTSAAVEGGKISVDLCEQHDRPVRLLEEIAKRAGVKAKRARGVSVDYLSSLIERDDK